MSRAQALRAMNTKEFTLPSGALILIRKVSYEDVIAEMADVPIGLFGLSADGMKYDDLTQAEKMERFKEMVEHRHTMAEFYSIILRLGVVEPRVVEIVHDPEMEVTVADFGGDRRAAIDAILEFSSVTGPKSESDEGTCNERPGGVPGAVS